MEVSSKAASKCFMIMYFLQPHWVPATWRSRAQTSIRAELPSGNVPTTRVRAAVDHQNFHKDHLGSNLITDSKKPQPNGCGFAFDWSESLIVLLWLQFRCHGKVLRETRYNRLCILKLHRLCCCCSRQQCICRNSNDAERRQRIRKLRIIHGICLDLQPGLRSKLHRQPVHGGMQHIQKDAVLPCLQRFRHRHGRVGKSIAQ